MKYPCCHIEKRTRLIFRLSAGQFRETDTSCSLVGTEDLPDNDFQEVPEKPVNHHHFRGIFPGLGGFRLEYFP